MSEIHLDKGAAAPDQEASPDDDRRSPGGMLDSLQRKADAMSYSGINGVMQLGEMLDLGVGITRAVPGMVKGARGYLDDADAVASGRDHVRPKEVLPTVLAADVAGLGNVAYGAAAGLGDLASRVFTPGAGADRYQQANAQLHGKLEQGFERWVQSHGVDTDSATYRKAKAEAQVVGAVVGAGAAKGKATPQAGAAKAIAGSADDVIEYRSAKVNGEWVAKPAETKYQHSPYAEPAQPFATPSLQTPLSDVLGHYERVQDHLAVDDFTAAQAQLSELEAGVGLLARQHSSEAPRAAAYLTVAQQALRDHAAAANSDAARAIRLSMADNSSIEMPRGVDHLPPVRPVDWQLSAQPISRIQAAIETWETNAYPVSDASYERPADPLFATFFKGLDELGTRSISMSELNALIDADVTWPMRMEGTPFALTDKVNTDNGVTIHEWHKVLSGFRIVPRGLLADTSFHAGMGGEQGLFARLTDEFEDTPDDLSTPEVLSFLSKNKFYAKELEQRESNSQAGWMKLHEDLTKAPGVDMPGLIQGMVKSGYFADPRQQEALSSILEALRSSVMLSPERRQAADELIDHFRQQEDGLRVVSVPAATAEIQLAQTLEKYLKRNRLDLIRGADQVDGVALYALYRQLLADGKLISSERVKQFLDSKGVPNADDVPMKHP
jgi:hypothetical protein